jgi:hypothetical protein
VVEKGEQFQGLIGHTQSVTQSSKDKQDTSRPAMRPDLSGPKELPAPSTELEMLIGQLVPPGALTWRVLPCSLPWTNPPGPTQSIGRPSDGVLDEVLEAAGVKEPAARDYILSGPFTEIMFRSPGDLHRNHGWSGRAMEVAAEHDISGRSLIDLASSLDLTDHQEPIPRQAGTVTGESRGGRRYLSHGRALLRALGVWPWAHVEDWSRTRRWWRDPTVFASLCAWHDKAWTQALEQLAFSARARYGQSTGLVITVEENEACRTFRERLAALGAERKDAAAKRDR